MIFVFFILISLFLSKGTTNLEQSSTNAASNNTDAPIPTQTKNPKKRKLDSIEERSQKKTVSQKDRDFSFRSRQSKRRRKEDEEEAKMPLPAPALEPQECEKNEEMEPKKHKYGNFEIFGAIDEDKGDSDQEEDLSPFLIIEPCDWRYFESFEVPADTFEWNDESGIESDSIIPNESVRSETDSTDGIKADEDIEQEIIRDFEQACSEVEVNDF